MDVIIKEINSIVATMVVGRAAIDSMVDSELAVSLYMMQSDIIERLCTLVDTIGEIE